MKHKLKKIFENAVWWSGVVMVGLVLGLTLQFVRAWTEPGEAPPGGNVGAPINTGPIAQLKNGILGVLGLTTNSLRVNPASGNPTGQVLTALNPSGDVTWAAGGGVPSGFVGFFNLSSCPSGWTELTAARGRYPVGLPSGGTLAGTQGTALSNLENRPAGAHTHSVGPVWQPYGSTQPTGGSAYAMDKPPITLTSDNGGLVVGTNAPYIQLLVCQKN